MPKSEETKTPRVQRVRHNERVTSEDMPGDGMAKRAAKALEERRRKRKEMLDNL